MYKCIGHHCTGKQTTIRAGDFNAQTGPGDGMESESVEKHELGEANKWCTWMKQWLVIQK